MPAPILTDKPEPGDILAQSQVDLQNDMEYIQHAFNKDHRVDFLQDSSDGTPAGNQQGRHRQVSFLNAASNNEPVPLNTSGLLTVFNRNIYWKSNTFANAVQMTNNNVGEPLAANNGYSFLPGGIMIQWGQSTIIAPASVPSTPVVVFAPPFSATPFTIQTTIIRNVDQNLTMYVYDASNVQFRVSGRSNGSSGFGIIYTWLAIGPK